MSLTVWPHDLVDDRYIYFAPWEWSLGTEWHSLDHKILGWVPDSDVHLRCEVSFDHEGLVRSAGLDTHDDLQVVTLADCPATGTRTATKTALSGAEKSAMITMELMARLFRASVSLEHHLLLGSSSSSHPIGARLLGTSEVHRLDLEENADRFPVEAFSFKELGFEGIDWRVEFEEPMEDSLWDVPFQQAVKLWINTDRFAGQCVLDRTHVLHDVFRVMLERDIIASVLSRIERDERVGVDVQIDSVETGSLGDAVQRIAQNEFGFSTRELLDLSYTDRSVFSRELQRVLPISEPRRGFK